MLGKRESRAIITVRTLSVISLGAIVTSLPADADPPPAVFKDSYGNVYVHSGVIAGSRLKVGLIGQPYKRTLRAGRCGQINLSPSATIPSLGNSVTINGKNIDLTKIATTSTKSKCTGNAFTPATSSNFKTSNGKITLIGYIVGQSYNVFFNNLPNTFNATVNGCAFAQIRPSNTRPLTSQLTINGTSYTVSALTTAQPPVCHKNSGTNTSTLYVPSSW